MARPEHTTNSYEPIGSFRGGATTLLRSDDTCEKNITLVDRRDAPLPYAQEVVGSSLRSRGVSMDEDLSKELAGIRYSVLGMSDLFIDFAGEKPEGHRIHRSLAGLQAGSLVTLERNSTGQIFACDRENVHVARLSKSAADGWINRACRRSTKCVSCVWCRESQMTRSRNTRTASCLLGGNCRSSKCVTVDKTSVS